MSSPLGRKSRALILSKWPGSNGDVNVSRYSICTHFLYHDAVDPSANDFSRVVVHSERLFGDGREEYEST